VASPGGQDDLRALGVDPVVRVASPGGQDDLRALGADPVVRVASPDGQDYLRMLGAEPVARGTGLVDQVLGLVPEGADAVFDAAGRGALAASAGALRPGARLASIAAPDAAGVTPVFARMDRGDLAAVIALAESGLVSVRVGALFPLAKAAEAQRALAAGNIAGKVILEIG
jgi:NADPH:quinone reductase-like Zn-dependent oxidoreductase